MQQSDWKTLFATLGSRAGAKLRAIARLRLGAALPVLLRRKAYGVPIALAQHTAETGQAFRPEARERIWTQTQGQPWLVNALCERACFESERGRAPLLYRG